MPYATSGDLRIHYTVAGSGPPVLLHHGFGGSSEDWRDFGLIAPLQDRYRLIMFDARGHGRSDKPREPASYSLHLKCADALAVLDHLGIERAHFYGYSYGGLMSWALGLHASERFASMVIGGAHPYLPEGPEMLGRYEAMLAYLGAGMDAYVRWREDHGTRWPAPFRTRMLANDPAALAAFLQATPGHYPLDPTPRMDMPVLVISAGDDELMAGSRARRAAAALPNGRYLEIPGADHPALYLQSHRVAPHICAFLTEVDAPLAPASP